MNEYKVYVRNESESASAHYTISAVSTNTMRITRMLIDANILCEESSDMEIFEKGKSKEKDECFKIEEVETFEA